MKLDRLVIVILMLAGGRAGAQARSAQAEAAFRDGKELMAKGEFAAACKAFDASQSLDPTVATQLNQADCRDKNGQLATAWGLFLEAERKTRTAPDAENQKLHRVALDHAQRIEPRVSKLTITVPPDSRVPGLEILRDADPLDPTVWNVSLPVDGGTYTISARAAGRIAWSTSITIGVQGDSQHVDVPKLEEPAPPVAPPPVAVPPPVVALPEPTPPQVTTPAPGVVEVPTSRTDIIPIAVGGGAVALGAGALGLELWGESKYQQAKDELVDESRRRSLYGSANDLRYAAQGVAVVGVAAAGAAIWLYLHRRHDTNVSVARHLVIAPTGIALVGDY